MRRATSPTHQSTLHAALFQSTLSMRRATPHPCVDPRAVTISIHALHEESDPFLFPWQQDHLISIHALHEESDLVRHRKTRGDLAFQSTLSMRRATMLRDCGVASNEISIHALHEESDSAAGHFCPLFETQASCLALSISNNTADTTNNMSKTSNWLSVSF